MKEATTTFDTSGDSNEPLFRQGAWGRLAMVLLPLVAVSGLALAFVYRPEPDQAWRSVAAIRGGDWGVVRDLHRWGGEVLLVAAWLHLFRVFMVGAYRRLPGWGVSVAGTLLIVASAVTGWALRYDAAASRAMDASGLPASGLPAVFALHVLLLPLALVVLVIPGWRGRRSATEDDP